MPIVVKTTKTVTVLPPSGRDAPITIVTEDNGSVFIRQGESEIAMTKLMFPEFRKGISEVVLTQATAPSSDDAYRK